MGRLAGQQYLLIAGIFPLFYQPLPNPPHQRVKPECGFDCHGNSSSKVIPTTNVAKFVGKSRVQLTSRQSGIQANRHKQHWVNQSKYSRIAMVPNNHTPSNSVAHTLALSIPRLHASASVKGSLSC